MKWILYKKVYIIKKMIPKTLKIFTFSEYNDILIMGWNKKYEINKKRNVFG